MTWAGLVLALVGRVVFSFADPAITESSGLVDLGDLMVTTNDSGGAAEVFVVDGKTGQTVGHTTFASSVDDVEALAPAGRDAVWVGDIGDNDEVRDSVQVYQVPVGRGDQTVEAPAYELTYPNGPHDAESLIAAPGGRLYVITKGLMGGTVYAAPRHLDPDQPNQLRAAGAVDVWATDAALFPDGEHVLVRGYDTAAIYTFPGFQPVATLDLPHQKQGEGVSIGASGRIRISSEGLNSKVLQVELTDALEAAVQGKPTHAVAGPVAPARADEVGDGGPGGLLAVAGAAAAAGVLLIVVSRFPRRSRRAHRR